MAVLAAGVSLERRLTMADAMIYAVALSARSCGRVQTPCADGLISSSMLESSPGGN